MNELQKSFPVISPTKYTDERIEALGTLFTIKGSVATYANLPSSGNNPGDVWLVQEDSSEYVYTANNTWEKIGAAPVFIRGSGEDSAIQVIADTTKANTASGAASVAFGSKTVASGSNAFSEGQNTTAGGNNSHAEGYYSTANGKYSHAEGESTTANNDSAHAEGQSTVAGGICSHAEGAGAKANNTCSHAEGQSTNATGKYSHAEGQSTTASGTSSHAEGYNTTANNDSAHAEGFSTTASGNSSHSGGIDSIAEGECSFAHGQSTHAIGARSAAFGNHTIVPTNGADQMVVGRYNEEVAGALFVVGDGTSSSNRSNALEVGNNGTDAYIKVGATILTEEELTKIISGIPTKFTNVSASSWVSSATYADYAYQCSIVLTGVTSSDYCSIIFDVTEATSGNYAPVCTTYDGGVIIYSKVDTAITIPAIIKY